MSRHGSPHVVTILPIPFSESGRYAVVRRAPRSRGTKCNVILVYGHHSTLERWMPLAYELARFGDVWMPDLPGFGGMSEARQSGSLDTFAKHLARFATEVVEDGPVLLCGVSFGFMIVKHAVTGSVALRSRCVAVVSLGGFSDGRSLSLRAWHKEGIRCMAWVCRHPWIQRLAQQHLLTYRFARIVDTVFGLTRARVGPDKRRGKVLCAADLELWRANALATHWATLEMMYRIRDATAVDLPLIHMQSACDPYLYLSINVKMLERLFQSVHVSPLQLVGHMPALDAPQAEYQRLFDADCLAAIQSALDRALSGPLPATTSA